MRTFVSDMDGCLLNSGDAFSQLWTEILGTEIVATDLTCWDHDWCLGYDKKLNRQFWNEIWNRPFSVYPGAKDFIMSVKALGYDFNILTSRPNEKAVEAIYRDLGPLMNLVDELYVCNQYVNKDKKSDFINRMQGARFFLEDNIRNAVDAKINSPDLSEVFLIDRPWNKSKDVVGYKRIYTYSDILGEIVKHG